MQKYQCGRCGHVYIARTDSPSKCPRCQVLFTRDSYEQQEEIIRVLRVDVKKPRTVTAHE